MWKMLEDGRRKSSNHEGHHLSMKNSISLILTFFVCLVVTWCLSCLKLIQWPDLARLGNFRVSGYPNFSGKIGGTNGFIEEVL
jgi:hypothetical protein